MRVTVLRANEWIGEISTNVRLLDMPGNLQSIVDDLTGRGVRPMPEKR